MSKPFSFKLQKILDYRTQLEDQAKAALAQAQAAYNAQAALAADLEERLRVHHDKAAESGKSANDMWLWRQYKEALEQDLSRERIVLNQLEHKLQQRRQEAIDRSKEKKLLEKLKENQTKKYHAQETAKELKENDEMATLRYKHEDL